MLIVFHKIPNASPRGFDWVGGGLRDIPILPLYFLTLPPTTSQFGEFLPAESN